MTTPRKPRPQETETDRRRTEKENITVTVDLSKQTGVTYSYSSYISSQWEKHMKYKLTDCVNNLLLCLCIILFGQDESKIIAFRLRAWNHFFIIIILKGQLPIFSTV